MPNLKQINIIGHLGKNPEQRSAGGKPCVQFPVAVSGRKKDDPPLWFQVTAWGKAGENCINHLTKGAAVYVSGEFDTFTTDEGRTLLKVNTNAVVFLSKPQQTARSPEAEIPI